MLHGPATSTSCFMKSLDSPLLLVPKVVPSSANKRLQADAEVRLVLELKGLSWRR